MATTTNFSVRMDGDIKKQCEALYGELGINLTTAINVFLRQSLRVGGFPFDVRLDQPNKESGAHRQRSFREALLGCGGSTEGFERMKHLDIIWTNQFKKDYKSAISRPAGGRRL